MGKVIKFPNDGRTVRFGNADEVESGTVIILPVVRIERYGADVVIDDNVPRTHPPAENGGRRRFRRR